MPHDSTCGIFFFTLKMKSGLSRDSGKKIRKKIRFVCSVSSCLRGPKQQPNVIDQVLKLAGTLIQLTAAFI